MNSNSILPDYVGPFLSPEDEARAIQEHQRREWTEADAETVRDCILLRCPTCNKVVMLTVNEPRVTKDSGEEIGKLLGEGFLLELVTTGEARRSKIGCVCNPVEREIEAEIRSHRDAIREMEDELEGKE